MIPDGANVCSIGIQWTINAVKEVGEINVMKQ